MIKPEEKMFVKDYSKTLITKIFWFIAYSLIFTYLLFQDLTLNTYTLVNFQELDARRLAYLMFGIIVLFFTAMNLGKKKRFRTVRVIDAGDTFSLAWWSGFLASFEESFTAIILGKQSTSEIFGALFKSAITGFVIALLMIIGISIIASILPINKMLFSIERRLIKNEIKKDLKRYFQHNDFLDLHLVKFYNPRGKDMIVKKSLNQRIFEEALEELGLIIVGNVATRPTLAEVAREKYYPAYLERLNKYRISELLYYLEERAKWEPKLREVSDTLRHEMKYLSKKLKRDLKDAARSLKAGAKNIAESIKGEPHELVVTVKPKKLRRLLSFATDVDVIEWVETLNQNDTFTKMGWRVDEVSPKNIRFIKVIPEEATKKLAEKMIVAPVSSTTSHSSISGETIKLTKTPLEVTCLECGGINIVKPTMLGSTTKCQYCGSKLPKCEICSDFITSEDTMATCPYCHHVFHEDHVLEWIKIKGSCPVCKQNLSWEDIE